MLIFPIFAVLIWSLAMQWRRQWPSFAIVSAAVVMLLGMLRIFDAWHEHLPPMVEVLYEFMWPYIGLTAGIGYYICFLPRPPTEMQCKHCRYDLTGLDLRDLKCPECGEVWHGKGSGDDRPVELTPILKSPPAKRRIM